MSRDRDLNVFARVCLFIPSAPAPGTGEIESVEMKCSWIGHQSSSLTARRFEFCPPRASLPCRIEWW